MTRDLAAGLDRVRALLLDDSSLVRAVATGRRRGTEPSYRRVELRHVDLKAGRHLQVVSYDATRAHTVNHAVGPDAAAAVDALLSEPFGNWHIEATTETVALRVTKKGDALVHSTARSEPVVVEHAHDRDKERLLPEDDQVFAALGLADKAGRLKPSRQAKYRQVEEFLRLLDTAIIDAMSSGRLRRPTVDDPLRIADLGCGNAYLTFAAERYLSSVRRLPILITGVDVREQSRERIASVAAELGVDVRLVVATIDGVCLDPPPEVVLALHACDTATDDALARGVEWGAALVLAAPCCHHDIAAQLRAQPTPAPYAALTRDGILRERLADTLTDALRASLMRAEGYRVDVVQFVESRHTPRNTLLRAVLTGHRHSRDEVDELSAAWSLRPRLADLLAARAPVGDRVGDRVDGRE